MKRVNSKPAYTPGPWNSCIQGIGKRSKIIAEMIPGPHCRSNYEANKRLMASSPFLLEAAEAAQVVLCNPGFISDNPGFKQAAIDAYVKLTAAILVAKGGN